MTNSNILSKIEEEIERQFPTTVEKEWITRVTGNPNTRISIVDMDFINAPCIDLLGRGGKRWRPLILVLISSSLGVDMERAIKLSPIVELIHNGTLLIDDIEDNSRERRGKKAVHLIYGEDVTINSGNHLYFSNTWVFEEITEDINTQLKLYKAYVENMRRLHLGQGMDIKWHRETNFIPTKDEYIQMCKYKTGCLASMSGEFAGILAEQDNNSIDTLKHIWEDIGVSFQIMDDIKNITIGIPGKERGDDIIEGKKSLPVILYCNRYDKKSLLKLISKAKKTEKIKYVEKAIKLLESTDVIDESREYATKMLKRALNQLNSLLPDNNYKSLLMDIFRGFIK